MTARSATARPRANGGGITNTGGGLVVVASAIPRNSAAPGGGIEDSNGGTRAPVASDLSDNEGGGLVDLTCGPTPRAAAPGKGRMPRPSSAGLTTGISSRRRGRCDASGRGRERPRGRPPAQIPTCGIAA
jgi:hypothetical protein